MELQKIRYRSLYDKYKNQIYSYSCYMLKNKMDAEDVTQEVLIRLWKNINKFNLMAAKTWIMKTTHNLCIDHIRKRNSVMKKEIIYDDNFEEIHEDYRFETNPFHKTHMNLFEKNIKEALAKLPENLSAVFILYQIHGMKYREISKILDIPLNTVKVNLLRARKKLQKELYRYELQEVI